MMCIVRSSSEDSEDNGDPFSWQQERRKYKELLSSPTPQPLAKNGESVYHSYRHGHMTINV